MTILITVNIGTTILQKRCVYFHKRVSFFIGGVSIFTRGCAYLLCPYVKFDKGVPIFYCKYRHPDTTRGGVYFYKRVHIFNVNMSTRVRIFI